MKKIAFGRIGEWEDVIPATIDTGAYDFACVDFLDFDLDAVDYAVPLTLKDARDLRGRYGDRHAKYLLPSLKAIWQCDDKKIFYQTAVANGFQHVIPPLYSETERIFPYVLKGREAEAGTQVFVIRNAADEAAFSARMSDDAYFCQAYVPGHVEYALHLLLVDGRMLYRSTNVYEMPGEYAVKGLALGPVDAIYGAETDPEVLNTLVKFLRSIDFNGVCCMDYKMVDGRLQILEVNPRVGFTLYRDINRFLPAYEQALGLTG